MKENKKELTGEESLKLINRMIYEAKGYFAESGLGALVYGFSILLCSLLTYAVDKLHFLFPFQPFFIMVPVFFIQAFIQMKENKNKKVKTFTDEAIDYVWTGFFLSVIAVVCVAGLSYMMFTITLFLIGLATFLTGMIAKFMYHKVCGIMCLVIADVSYFTQNSNVYLLLALTAVLVWIIPGFILRIYFKKQTQCYNHESR